MMLARVRAFFAELDVLEVETPLAGRSAGTDPQLEPVRAHYIGPGAATGTTLYLQTSPEFAMKRLLADGSGPIYQVCKAFRDGEAGRLHNPEFTILEWYRPGLDLGVLIEETLQLIRLVLSRGQLAAATHRYADLFQQFLDVDVFAATPDALRTTAIARGVSGAERLDLDIDGWLDLLMSHVIQPRLGGDQLDVVVEFPASQAALARHNPDGRTAARFEIFHQGVELANGSRELGDPDEQAARFAADNRARRSAGRQPVAVDQALLGALQAGLPDCVGVAVGLDRLLMLSLGRANLDSVLSFSFDRC
jgi:lysyl-tRNA synthetase class 2